MWKIARIKKYTLCYIKIHGIWYIILLLLGGNWEFIIKLKQEKQINVNYINR